jgi:hypothetical protein
VKDRKLPQAKGYIEKHRRLSVWHKLLLSMAAVVVFMTTYMLILPAITMENNVICGMTEHTHTDACYEENVQLICDMEDAAQPAEDNSALGNDLDTAVGSDLTAGDAAESYTPHTHSDECYSVEKTLVCGLEEHTHSEECYPEEAAEEAVIIDPESDEYTDMSDSLVEVKVIEGESLFESTMRAAENSSYADGSQMIELKGVTGNGTKYNSSTDTYTTSLSLNFNVTKEQADAAIKNNTKYVLELPSELMLTDSMLTTTYTGSYGSGGTFTFTFEQDENGVYYIVISLGDYGSTFDNSTTALGYASFSAEINHTARQDDESLKLTFGGDYDFTIDPSDITFPSGSTGNYDISTDKSSSYSYADNKLTYTVKVYSDKGTPDVVQFEDSIAELKGTVIKDWDIKVYSATVSQGEWDSSTTVTQGSEITGSDLTVDGSGSVTGTLPQLAANEGYIIEYTYNLDELDEDFEAYLYNTVKASSEISPNLSVSAEKTNGQSVKNPKIVWISKSGYASGDTITWTIVAGDGERTDLSGCKLTDEMFKEAANLNVNPGDGYTYSAEDGTITFSESCENKKYTITYNTTATGWDATDNTAYLYDKDDNELGVGKATASGSSQGSVNKQCVWEVANDNGVKTVKWQVNVTVPTGGIPAGTVTDELSNGESAHYISYSDAQGIIEALKTNFGDKVSNIVFLTKDYTTVAAADITEGAKYYYFNYDFAGITADEAAEYDVLSYEYTTTADTNMALSSSNYSNTVKFVGKSSYANFESKKRVIKTNGKGGTGTTKTTDKDGNVSWIVKINLDEDATSGITVTDSLPAEVDLSSLEISYNNGSSYEAVATDGTSYGSNITIATSVDSSNVATTEIKAQDSSNLPTTLLAGSSIYLRYTCKVEDSEMPTTGRKTIELANSAEVTMGDTDYGSATQTEMLTVGQENEVLNKSYGWDKDSQSLSYRVVINPDSTQLGDGTSYELTDTLNYYDDENKVNTAHRILDVDISSIKLYYIKTDEDGNLVLNADGEYEKGEAVPAEDWDILSYTTDKVTWTFSSGPMDSISKIIKLKFPDKQPLIFEYKYNVLLFEEKEGGYGDSIFQTNTVKIGDSVYGTSKSTTCKENWEAAEATAGIYTYSIYKHTANKLNEGLKGAKFDLYGYDSSVGDYVYVDSFLTDDDGNIGIHYGSDDFVARRLYYLVEVLPPEGYALPDEPEKMYFYMSSINGGKEDNNMPDVVPESAVDLLSPENRVVTKSVENAVVANTELKISKKWLNSEGEEISAGADSVTANVLRYIREKGTDSAARNATVDYSIKANSGTGAAKTGKGISVPTGSTVSLKFTYTMGGGVWTPEIKIYKNGVLDKDLPMGSSWGTGADALNEWVDNHSIYTYTFTADEDTEITGTIGCNDGEYSLEVEHGEGVNTSVLTGEALKEDGYEFYEKLDESYVLNEANNWTATVSDLPLGGIVNGKYMEFAYTVQEADKVSGYDSEIEIVGSDVTIKNIKSDKKYITVNKEWYNAEGEMFDPAVGSISFELWQKATDSSGNVVDEAKALNELFTIEAPSWTKQIDVTDLPTVGTTTDGQEVSYTYFVKEDAVSGFDTVYENNGGITDSDVDGTIVIKNKQQKSYELPMTGGRGTIGYTMAGGAMILLAVCLYIQNKRQGGLA